MMREKDNKETKSAMFYVLFVVLIIIVGVATRFYAMSFGSNFDFESYKIVGDIVRSGGNVYAETARYNYGPVWFTILGIFRVIGYLFSNPDLIFRICIVGLLTMVDIAIAFLLQRKYGLVAFTIFLLNPISIIVTGYHNQFDNLAILIGLLAVLVFPERGIRDITNRHIYGAILLGLSLMTKHILFILPIWLFLRERSLKVKLVVSSIPIVLFGAGFVPFVGEGYMGIVQNVFLYDSFSNTPFLRAIFSKEISSLIHPTALLIVALIMVGFMARKLPILEASLWYLVTLVIFSPAIANQYLAIVMPAVAVFGISFFLPFIALASILLIITSADGLHVTRFIDNLPERLLPYISQDGFNGQYRLITVALFAGAVCATIYRYRKSWIANWWSATRDAVSEQYKDIFQR